MFLLFIEISLKKDVILDSFSSSILILLSETKFNKVGSKVNVIVKEVIKKVKRSNHLNRLVTLSPLTNMATKFHKKNGAKLLQVNEKTQNFEYKVI